MPVTKLFTAKLQVYFATLTDPRRPKITHPFVNFIVIAICAVICGADDFVAITDFARARKPWFARFLGLSNGIPSHDRFNAIFATIKASEFERCLLSWLTALHEVTQGQVIAIDGKTLRDSLAAASGKSAIHMVSAWATANSISLGQVVTDEKSNEITAIPKLLEILVHKGAIVTIDAMGCQTEIARKIVAGGGDYILNVKGNQPTLRDGIEQVFASHLGEMPSPHPVQSSSTERKSHGRKESRWSYVCTAPKNLPGRDRWPSLKAIGMLISNTTRDGKDCIDVRYYILGKKFSAKILQWRSRAAGRSRTSFIGNWLSHSEKIIAASGKDTPIPTSARFAGQRSPCSKTRRPRSSGSRTSGFQQAGTSPTSSKSFSARDLWCNRPGLP